MFLQIVIVNYFENKYFPQFEGIKDEGKENYSTWFPSLAPFCT